MVYKMCQRSPALNAALSKLTNGLLFMVGSARRHLSHIVHLNDPRMSYLSGVCSTGELMSQGLELSYFDPNEL